MNLSNKPLGNGGVAVVASLALLLAAIGPENLWAAEMAGQQVDLAVDKAGESVENNLTIMGAN